MPGEEWGLPAAPAWQPVHEPEGDQPVPVDDVYHTVKSAGNEAYSLASYPPHTTSTSADLSLLHGAVSDLAILRKDKFDDDLAAELFDPKAGGDPASTGLTKRNRDKNGKTN